MKLRVAFDIGGVISKYPEILREMSMVLLMGGAEVYVITDMHNHAAVVHMLAANGFDFIAPDRVHCADYTTHGEGCKAELLRELDIHVMLDDFVGYVADPGCPVRCLVMPDSSRPYYADDWKAPDGEMEFGRRTYQRPR